MLNSTLKILSINGSNLPNQKLVSVGIAITEDDTQLTNKWISAIIDWGDGTPNLSIDPIKEKYNENSTAILVKADNLVTLSLTPEPYTGQFQLVYNGTDIDDIEWNTTAFDLQTLLRGIAGLNLDSSQKIQSVSGISPNWVINCSSPVVANLFSAGTSDIFALKKIGSHAYPVGNFNLKFTARNYKTPSTELTINQAIQLITAKVTTKPGPVIFGPILPADAGFPNPQQWSFDTSTDLKLLASNIKMILITQLGERVMLPDYGTNLKRYIWEPNDQITQNDIQQEVKRAITTWEPRVIVEVVQVIKDGTTANILIGLVSKLNQERFQLNIELDK